MPINKELEDLAAGLQEAWRHSQMNPDKAITDVILEPFHYEPSPELIALLEAQAKSHQIAVEERKRNPIVFK
jgi:hypothetical protein